MNLRVLALTALFFGPCAGAATLIAPGTYLIEGEATANRQPDGNSIIISAPKGLIVVDTGRHREHTQLVLDFALAQGQPIAAIINSHLESHAVTAGDVWVFDPQTRVLLAGDLVTLPAPFFESACPARWRESLGHLTKTPFDWLVPGHGAPMRPAEFAAYRKAFDGLLECAAGDPKQTACVDAWINDASTLLRSSRDVSYARTLIAYYIQNYLRHPSERIRGFCVD